MSFIDICWLIVKVAAGVIAFCLALGFAAKQIGKAKEKKFGKGDENANLPPARR